MGKRLTAILPIILFALIVISAILSLWLGAYSLDSGELLAAIGGKGTATHNYLIWQIRLPRIILALVIGGGLALTGAAIQGLFRNPLAEPSFIGVSSGAMLFAVATLAFNYAVLPWLPAYLHQFAVSFGAFMGALFTTWIVYRVASHRGQIKVTTMLLAGIAITAMAGAFTGLIIYYSDEQQLRDITFWTMGSLAAASWTQVAICAPIVLLGSFFIRRDALALNALLLGEGDAMTLGFNVGSVKRRVIFWSALIVGVCISMTGLIGFVGLIIPHLLRIGSGTDYRSLLLHSLLLGAGFMCLADTLARTIVAPAELPIGIITATVGSPFFIWLLLRHQQKASKGLAV
ncbi:MAG: iron ABC transporter permease [Bacteroidota bacterium]